MSITPEFPDPDTRVLHMLLRSRALRFPEDLEAAFRAQYNATAARATRGLAVVMLLVIAVFSLLDLYALPTSYRDAWALRPWLQGAPALLLALFSAMPGVVRRIQGLLAGSLAAGGLGTLCILAQAQPDEWGYFLYPYALAQIAALAYNGSRLRLPYAVVVGLFLVLGYVLTALVAQDVLGSGGSGVAFVLAMFFLLAINIIGALSCRQSEQVLRRGFVQQHLIEHEHARAEALLHNMLPAPIAERLKRREMIADTIDSASVLFADLTRFTELAARAPAARVVALLDAVFTRFDALADKYGVEKIKTIGDAYMAASGVPVARPDHAQALARMALGMRAAVTDLRVLEPDLDLRIGIATGPLVAGVIGSKRQLYDLWGDTVNVASRLESQGFPGQIQVDAATHALIQDQFDLVSRGSVTLKGRGVCVTYWLMSSRQGPA